MIELIFERTWLQIKGMKAMFAIPFVGYYVLFHLESGQCHIVWILF